VPIDVTWRSFVSRLSAKTTTTTQQRPLYRSTCVNWHLQLRTGGYCWCNVLIPTCPCWQQPAYLDYAEDAGVLHILTLSLCLQCFDAVGWAPACKKTEWWGAGVVICLERGADMHMAQLMPLPLTVSCLRKNQIGFTFLVPAHLGSTGQRAVKRVCVCVCVCTLSVG